MWRRHCRALLRKHVFPLLYSPLPRVNEPGHVDSIPPGYSEALLAFDGAEGVFKDFTGVEGGCAGNSGRFGLTAFGDALIGSYLPGGTANAPDEEPSTNSMGGGSRLLKASLSLDGRYCRESSAVVNDGCMGKSGDASIAACRCSSKALSVELEAALRTCKGVQCQIGRAHV